MSLSNKYNIPQETVNKMVRDGVISCSWPAYEQIYAMYKKSMSIPGAIKSRVVVELADKVGYSERQVRAIISKVE